LTRGQRAEFLLALKRGDPQVTEQVIVDFEPQIRRWVSRLMSGRSSQDIDDVCQDVLLESVLCLNMVRGDRGGVRPWLRAVTRNVVCGFYRRESRSKWLELAEPLRLDELHPGKCDTASREMREVLLELDPREARLLTLHYVEGWGLAEMARKFEVSVSSIKRSLRRGHERARKKLTVERPSFAPAALAVA
jgi:RNA polymerase sigma-70 factor (ECF subfamily)